MPYTIIAFLKIHQYKTHRFNSHLIFQQNRIGGGRIMRVTHSTYRRLQGIAPGKKFQKSFWVNFVRRGCSKRFFTISSLFERRHRLSRLRRQQQPVAFKHSLTHRTVLKHGSVLLSHFPTHPGLQTTLLWWKIIKTAQGRLRSYRRTALAVP